MKSVKINTVPYHDDYASARSKLHRNNGKRQISKQRRQLLKRL